MTNHPKDRHVLAAAVRCGAQAIITSNRKDFPHTATSPHGIIALTPGQFLIQLFQQNQARFIQKRNHQAAARGISLASLADKLQLHAPACAPA